MSKNKYDFNLHLAEKNNSHTALAMRIKAGQRVLELGCSSGYLSKFLKEERSCEVVGVDMNAYALEQATPFCQQVIIADLDRDDWLAELKGQQFDVVLCADVLEHLKNPVSLLTSLQPFFTTEAYLLASVPNVAHVSVRLELLQGHFDYEPLGILDNTHLRFYTRQSLLAMLQRAGYTCHDISYSINDMADEAIALHLSNVGLALTDKVRQLFHAPDATAFQYIIEARLASMPLEDNYSTLSPKPLVSSGAWYHEKQIKIDQLEQDLLNQQQQYQQQIAELSALNQTAVLDSIEYPVEKVDDTLFVLAEQLHEVQSSRDMLLQKVAQLEEREATLAQEVGHLEQVLQRVHRKISYRLVRGVKGFVQRVTHREAKIVQPEMVKDISYHAWWQAFGNFSAQMSAPLKALPQKHQPPQKIAVLMPLDNPNKADLVCAIESVLQQCYSTLELCLAGDCSISADIHELLTAYQTQDTRVKLIFSKAQGDSATTSQAALSLVTAKYITLMGQGDTLEPKALSWVLDAIYKHPKVELIYTDEDKIDVQGQYSEPYFKPNWNSELFLSHDFISHLGIYRTEKVKALGGFDFLRVGAEAYDLSLRYVESLNAEEILHIPRVLYHCRESQTQVPNTLHEIARVNVVSAALQQRQRPAEVTIHSQLANRLRVRYLLPKTLPKVSFIIPTRNGFHLLHRCIESLFAKTSYVNYELIIIDNGSDELVTLRYLQRLQQDPRVTVIRDNRPFNYSALNNKAVTLAKGEVIAFLNNDIEVIHANWLDEMVSHVCHKEVGAVGAKLYYPNDTVQHAGVITGIKGVAGHGHKYLPRTATGYCGRLLLVQNLSAVTAACLLVRKDVFEAVGGFDEDNLSIAFNDVDLCLRIQKQGWKNVWTPYAELYHHESASRGYEDTPEKQARFNQEVSYMKQRWGEHLLLDAAYSPNLTLDSDDFSFAWPPRV